MGNGAADLSAAKFARLLSMVREVGEGRADRETLGANRALTEYRKAVSWRFFTAQSLTALFRLHFGDVTETTSPKSSPLHLLLLPIRAS